MNYDRKNSISSEDKRLISSKNNNLPYTIDKRDE